MFFKEIVIIGGGPAGIMAAIASKNSDNLILEKNSELGLKLLITGHGRCNITNNKNIKDLLAMYKNKNFLKHSFYTFTNDDLLDLFKIEFVEEDNNRVFPKDKNARDILNILKKYLDKVDIKYNYKVDTIINVDDYFIINNEIKASKVIIATGGMTYQHTGSTGDGFKLASKLNHSILKPYYGLTAIKCFKDNLLEGVVLKDVVVSSNNDSYFGDIVITKDGLTGPPILNLSNNVLNKIAIDFCYNFTKEELNLKFINDFSINGKLMIKNYLKRYLTNSFVEFFLNRLGISPDKLLSNLNKKERNLIINNLKEFTIAIFGVDEKRSKITVGGVSLDEINSKTMESKLVKDLYFAGEVLDIVGPSGGYNLKIAFSTGYLAGISSSNF